MTHHGFAFVLIAALAAPSMTLAQEATDPPAEDGTVAVPEAADTMGKVDCDSDFSALDVDGDGYISQTESARDTARATIDGVTPATEGLSRDQFLAICGSETWSQTTPEAGAPFEGANSFTEEQARDRAVAWNVTDVSALVKDDQGIWRGTGKVGAEAVAIAIDYKGNVVTTPAVQ
ncbi:hypothetical protein [Paracoccus sp. IB05]|uniref:hypothetical protein n=1 Tax=Paracoccus sp. IB05 TaxID=2779367 RepID=UPI0018E86299|nr:hypothetical protein [Paracoccus sp. IB05]MBJ2149814.1 hypothetical protein [Paracoccus sp. IB05]